MMDQIWDLTMKIVIFLFCTTNAMIVPQLEDKLRYFSLSMVELLLIYFTIDGHINLWNYLQVIIASIYHFFIEFQSEKISFINFILILSQSYSFKQYSGVLNKRRGTLIKFLTNFQPLCPYSIPYIYWFHRESPPSILILYSFQLKYTDYGNFSTFSK